MLIQPLDSFRVEEGRRVELRAAKHPKGSNLVASLPSGTFLN